MSGFTLRLFLCACVSLLVSLYSTSKADQPGSIPEDVTDLLRHDKHALLYYPEINGWLEDAYLITRKKTYHKGLSISNEDDSWVHKLHQSFSRIDSTPSDSVFSYCREAYVHLIGIFEEELEDIYQITIVSGSKILRTIPFESFVKYEFSEGESPRFLTEFWAVSYLYDLDFARIENRDLPDKILWDSSGAHLHSPPPREGTSFFHRWPDQTQALPPGKVLRFNELVSEGSFTDEALGLTRSEYLDSIRRNKDLSGLDPRIWASGIVYGEIAPINPPFSFPWWILVPIGLVLVITFGRKL